MPPGAPSSPSEACPAARAGGARAGRAPPAGVVAGRAGAPLDRYRGREMVLGERPFVDDLARPGMLHGAVTLSPHARARVRGIDVSRARAHPGVVAVATA